MCAQIPFVRDPYNYDRDSVSKETAFYNDQPGKTQQSQKEEADINTIVKRFGLTGQLPSNVRVPQYGDFTGVTDYQSALNAVQAANDAFMKYPAYIRERFKNDPALFVEFCSNPENREEAEKLGLVPKKAVKTASATEGAQATAVGDKKPDSDPKTA